MRYRPLRSGFQGKAVNFKLLSLCLLALCILLAAALAAVLLSGRSSSQPPSGATRMEVISLDGSDDHAAWILARDSYGTLLRVTVTPSTRILDPEGDPVFFSALAPGLHILAAITQPVPSPILTDAQGQPAPITVSGCERIDILPQE
ncbi:MAG: hypothetical protein ACI4OU_05380 [Candidatus Enterenecus sp.]